MSGARLELFREYVCQDLSDAEARALAREHGVRVPHTGYEVALGNGLWLASAGHHQFGWFGSHAPTPFRLHGYRKGGAE